jgi:hypothetical protein
LLDDPQVHVLTYYFKQFLEKYGEAVGGANAFHEIHWDTIPLKGGLGRKINALGDVLTLHLFFLKSRQERCHSIRRRSKVTT